MSTYQNTCDTLTQNDLGVVLNALSQPAKARECFQRALQLTAGLDTARENLDALPPNA